MFFGAHALAVIAAVAGTTGAALRLEADRKKAAKAAKLKKKPITTKGKT